MRRNDTIDRGPNKLLLKDWDAQNYFKHRRRLSEMKPLVDFGTGEHIVRVSPHGPRHQRLERAHEIMHTNQVLFQRIKEVLDRPAYVKKVMFDSKKVAAKAALSPVALAKALTLADESSFADSSSKQGE